jgi:hypothetical protein
MGPTPGVRADDRREAAAARQTDPAHPTEPRGAEHFPIVLAYLGERGVQRPSRQPAKDSR